MTQWAFNETGLQLAMQLHFGRMVQAGKMDKAEAETTGSVILSFLRSPEAGVLRLDPVTAEARSYVQALIRKPAAVRQGAGAGSAGAGARGA